MPKGRPWLASEIDFIVENVEKLTVKEMESSLEGRSAKAIRRMIEKLRDKGSVEGYKYKKVSKRAHSKEKKDDVWGEVEWE